MLDVVSCPPELTKDLWTHGKHCGFTESSMFQHCHRLFDTSISTKECLEDVIGSLTDCVSRGNKNPMKALAPERAFFEASRSFRWSNEWPVLEPQHGDLENKACTTYETSRTRLFSVNPRQGNSVNTHVSAAFQRALGTKNKGRDWYEVLFKFQD